MRHRTAEWLIGLAFAASMFAIAGPAWAGMPQGPNCRPGRDSVPTSLGADGWAAVGGAVTGGCGAAPARVFDVSTRAQLVDALTQGHMKGHGAKQKKLDHHPKILYVHGTIDLNVDDANVPLTEEDYMRMCNYTAHETFYDPVTGDQTGSGGFFGAYKAAYDPNLWIRQSLDPADNRPPALSGPLEAARLCFQQQQAQVVVIDVGSNTSIVGVGSDARIKNGSLRIGFMNQNDPGDPDNYQAENVVIRNITFMDAFDMFPSWDPKDSFSITITNTNGCQAVYDPATDSGPHRCTFRGGRWNAEYDSIAVMNAEGVWIDHNTFTDEPRFDTEFPPVFGAPFNEATQKVQHHDGQADVTLLGTRVTISNNQFVRHDKTNLLGGSDVAGLVPGYGPGVIDVTFHGNYYQNTGQRMPRVRFGRVHVYNNVMDVDRRSSAEYRLGDSWILGTAAKLVTENNLFDILNSNTNFNFRIVQYASTLANRDVCVAAGYTLEECGTYYYNQGTWINLHTTSTSSIFQFDAFAAAQALQAGSAANAPLISLDPANPDVFWFPTQTYSYTLLPVGTPDERAALRQQIVDNAGAGKLLP
jgi:pectate lyase